MKKKYWVECTVVYNGVVEVEAENATDAMSQANELLNKPNEENQLPRSGYVGDVYFGFGEVTADYAEEDV